MVGCPSVDPMMRKRSSGDAARGVMIRMTDPDNFCKRPSGHGAMEGRRQRRSKKDAWK
jgi:hypothetical protein